MAESYRRETDGTEMVEVAPHQFVNRRLAEAFGLIGHAAPAKREGKP